MATSDPTLLAEIVNVLWRLKPQSVLDVGAGFGKVGFLVREYLDVYQDQHYKKGEWKTVLDGIEIHEEFVTDVHRHLYDNLHIGNALEVLPRLGRYDLIFALDVIEHLSKEDGCRLLSLMREHGKTVIVSTPKDFFEQGAVMGNPHERHVSHWTPEELGLNCRTVGNTLIAEIGGESLTIHMLTEAAPGWALYPLCSDMAEHLRKGGHTVHLYAWDDPVDIERVKQLVRQDPSVRIYVSTGPAAEGIHRDWGIPRQNMYFLFHAMSDMEKFDDNLCRQYAAVGYINESQGAILRGKGIKAVYVPQYVDLDRFTPAAKDHDELVVGVALAALSNIEAKNMPLLEAIMDKVDSTPGMRFDRRAIKSDDSPGLPYDEMPDFYRGLDVLICTSKEEGGPLPPLQAAACGVSTVSTRCGHMPEFIVDGSTGYLVEPIVQAFMDILQMFAFHRDRCKETGERAREQVAKYWCPANVAPNWEELVRAAEGKAVAPAGIVRTPDKPRLHLLGIPHTQTSKTFLSCAFSMKILKFAKMMTDLGYEVIHYGCEGSEAAATENVDVVTNDYRLSFYPDTWKNHQFRFDQQDDYHKTFHKRCVEEIEKRLTGRDFLLCQWGWGHQPVAAALGDVTASPPGKVMAIEHGIGYEATFAKFRAFESSAWMHYIYGKQGVVNGGWYDAVIPNYFSVDDFVYNEDKEDWLLYLGRVIDRKGVSIAIEAAAKTGHKIKVAGQPSDNKDDWVDTSQAHVEVLGYADWEMRRELLSKAKALMCPTRYIGPFEGVAVEALLSGTPVISTDFGVFHETIPEQVGFRCRTLNDFVHAIRHIDDISPQECRRWAMNYSVDAVGPMYVRWFNALFDLWSEGWNTIHPETE